jgi:predicted RNA methylase
MEQDTGKFRTNTHDQYYTRASVAKQCVDLILSKLPEAAGYQWIEPSAGNGVFMKCVPTGFDVIGIDIDPKADGIHKGNFLDWEPSSQKRRIFFGNPPFGRQSSLAKSFIKHAGGFADVIAFILPRSFVKPSMNRAFPLRFHCLHSEELEKGAFVVNDVAYDVPCVFQIWQKREVDREVAAAVKEEGFAYVKHGCPFHIAFKRVGGLAGKCYPATDEASDYNPQFHYFLRLDELYIPHSLAIIEKVNQHTFPSNTVGPRSLSKSEANEVLNEVLKDVGPSS